MKKLLRLILITGFCLCAGLFFVSGGVRAASSVAQGYISSDKDLKTGMAVSLAEESNNDQQFVVRASTTNKSKYLGIVTRIDDAVLTISDKSSTIYVSNSGQHQVYVSTVNGEVKKGDLLVLSPLKGILMKANMATVTDTSIAVALSDLNSDNSNEQQVSTNDGTTKNVSVGRIDAEVITGTISNQQSDKNFVSVFGESLTGRPVSDIRVVIACIILLIVLIVEGTIIYGAVSSSIIAVGRNPLSRKEIYKQLVHTSLLSLAILLIGATGIIVVIYT